VLALNQSALDAEARFQATFEQAAVGIAHVAPDGSWLRVNQRLCDIIGYCRDELMGRTFQDITHPDDLNSDLAKVQQMLRGEIPSYSMEKRYFHKNGDIVWINLTVSLLWKTVGEPDYFISVVEDISLRKAAEGEIARLTQSLVSLQESERQYLALELHDEIGQRLSAIKFSLSVARKKSLNHAVLPLLDQIHDITNSLITSIKGMAHALRPSQLDDFGLLTALRALVEDIGEQSELAISVEENIGERRFPPEIELTGYRVVQEALSNVLRHSRSQRVCLRLHQEQGELTISISDEGLGFDQTNSRLTHGLGLIGMRERVSALAGKFTVDSAPGKGATVKARLPLQADPR
jgi:two-component system sensor histidine kinase UhpB